MQVRDENKNRKSILLLFASCFLLQLLVAPNVALASGKINFPLIYAFLFALRFGGKKAVASGFCFGIFFDLTAISPLGLMAFLLTLLSYLIGASGREGLKEDLKYSLLSFAASSFVVIFFYHLAMLFVGATHSFFELFVLRTLPSFILTFLAFFIIKLVLLRLGGSSSQMFKGKHQISRPYSLTKNKG